MPSGYYADVVNTSAANSFTRVQTFTPNAADIGSVSTVLNNGDFETGDSNRGRKATEATRLKLSDSHKGKAISKDVRQKMSESQK
jgi:hypothetical protein